MPPNPERRLGILDAAIEILVDIGIAGVTHRQVDERAGLPAGTTSNYFRTRLALLEATAARVVDLHWQHVESLRAALPTPLTRDGLATLLTRMVSELDDRTRRRHLARFELFMEGTRRPELRPFLTDLQVAAMKSAGLILGSAGVDATPEQVEQLARLLNGLVFSNLTISPPARDPARLVTAALSAVLGA